MLRSGIVATLAVLILGTSSNAGENPQIAALRQQIKALGGQRDNAIKQIHAHYDSIIRQDKLSEKDLEKARAALGGQEKQMLEAAKVHEERTLKQIHGHYDSIIRMDKRTDKELEQERAIVREQEKILLSGATNDSQRAQIRGWYDSLRHYLTRDVKLDEKQIRELRGAEHAHIEHTKAAYNEHRRKIKEHFEHMRRYLAGDIRMDARQIAEMRNAEKVHSAQIRASYDQTIKQLEAEIRNIEHQAKDKPKSPPKK
jgi:hypothetical protein